MSRSVIYPEAFGIGSLGSNARCGLDIRGHALEFGDTAYLDRFGGDRVRRNDVFSSVDSAGATIVGDLTGPTAFAPDTFDCIVCTQTVQMIYDIRLAIKRLPAMLKPRGVLSSSRVASARRGATSTQMDGENTGTSPSRPHDRSLPRISRETPSSKATGTSSARPARCTGSRQLA